MLKYDGMFAYIVVWDVMRPYAYSAQMVPKTGRVVRITAGCRDWPSFKAAYNHYEPDNSKHSKRHEWDGVVAYKSGKRYYRWSDAWIRQRENPADWWRCRTSSVRTLKKLEKQVLKYQASLQPKSSKRKSKVAVKKRKTARKRK